MTNDYDFAAFVLANETASQGGDAPSDRSVSPQPDGREPVMPRPDTAIHLVMNAPTSLHGNGAASFALTTRDPEEVSCKLCLYLWHSNPERKS